MVLRTGRAFLATRVDFTLLVFRERAGVLFRAVLFRGAGLRGVAFRETLLRAVLFRGVRLRGVAFREVLFRPEVFFLRVAGLRVVERLEVDLVRRWFDRLA